tara:strand:- start:13 stop:324 length:312 start_codon:yes stop_codon:yes gene_type:complete
MKLRKINEDNIELRVFGLGHLDEKKYTVNSNWGPVEDIINLEHQRLECVIVVKDNDKPLGEFPLILSDYDPSLNYDQLRDKAKKSAVYMYNKNLANYKEYVGN